MKKIAVLDSFAIREGDLDWSGLTGLADEIVIYPRTVNEQAIQRIGDADAAILNKVWIGEEVLAACPQLKWIGLTATGTDSLDLEACRRHGVPVANVPAYSTDSVAQLAFALLLELCQCPGRFDNAIRGGFWQAGIPPQYGVLPQLELAGKTLGIVGYGAIGRRAALLGQAFGMRVLVHTRTARPDACGIRFVDLDVLLAESDAVTLHCPVTVETRGLLDGRRLALCKPGVRIVNTARGALVDEAAMAAALCRGQVGGYAADVVSKEPITPDNPLLGAPNTILTPHIAWATPEALGRLAREVCENLRAFLRGEARNIVNGPF